MLKRSVVAACLFLAACSPSTGETMTQATGSESGSSTTSLLPPTTDPTTSGSGTSTTTGSSSTGDPTTGASTTGTTTAATATTAVETGGGDCTPIQCEGAQYACGDCMDNDGDGKVDLADPECVSPCDDLEDTFATGLPGDNMDPCNQDCFFDGNSGAGAGDCKWNLKCDPMSPGGDKCPYDPDYKNCPDMQSQECVETCQVPNGCDCFGCCTVAVDGMSYDIYIGDKDCALDKIESCETCTKNDDCDEECHPEMCEVCFGQEPPKDCDPTCDGGQGCTIDNMGGSDCPEGFYCSTGCCYPIVPG